MSSAGKRQNECSVSCRCRCCLPRHGDPHGPRGGPRGSGLPQGGRVEQLLHATAHAQRMPPVDALLLAPTVSAGESPLCGSETFCSEVCFFSPHSSGHLFVRLSTSLRPSGRCRPIVTTSQPKCSEPDSRRTLRDERQRRSSGGKPPRPSEQVRTLRYRINTRNYIFQRTSHKTRKPGRKKHKCGKNKNKATQISCSIVRCKYFSDQLRFKI